MSRIHDPFEKEMKNLLEYPPMDKATYGDGLVAASVELTPEKLEELHSIQLRHAGLPAGDSDSALRARERFRTIWHDFSIAMLGNPRLTSFEENYGARSKYFVPWQRTIPRAVALEGAFGWVYDFAGHWSKVESDDPFFWWIIREPMFVYLRERAMKTAEALASAKDVLFLGAGHLPELRHVGLKRPTLFVTACDNDSATLGELMSNSYVGDNVCTHNISYHHLDISRMLDYAERLRRSYDVIVMNGVAAYYYHRDGDKVVGFLPHIVERAVSLLRPGGKFIFDFQLNHWNLLRDYLVFNWKSDPPMALLKDEDEVYAATSALIRALPVTPDYFIDSRNEDPTGVMVHLTKW